MWRDVSEDEAQCSRELRWKPAHQHSEWVIDRGWRGEVEGQTPLLDEEFLYRSHQQPLCSSSSSSTLHLLCLTCWALCSSPPLFFLFQAILPISLSHTHTHSHTSHISVWRARLLQDPLYAAHGQKHKRTPESRCLLQLRLFRSLLCCSSCLSCHSLLS